MPSRAPLIALVSVVVIAGTAVGITVGSANGAASILRSSSCVTDTEGSAPAEPFFAAVARLDSLGRLPWIPGRARAAATESSLACLETYNHQCDAMRDHAVDAASHALLERMEGEGSGAEGRVEWRAHLDATAVEAFCAEWQAWRLWLDAQGLEPAGGCALCAEAR